MTGGYLVVLTVRLLLVFLLIGLDECDLVSKGSESLAGSIFGIGEDEIRIFGDLLL